MVGPVASDKLSEVQAPNPPPPNPKKGSLGSKVVVHLQKGEKVSRRGWRYVGKIRSIAQKSLQFAIKLAEPLSSGVKHIKRMDTAVAGFKTAAVAGFFFTCLSLKDEIKGAVKSAKTGDHEGLGLSIASALLETVDLFDTSITIAGGASALAGTALPAALNALGLPLGFFLTISGSIMGTVSVAQSAQFLKKMSREMEVELQDGGPEKREQVRKAVVAFLRTQLGMKESEITNLKDEKFRAKMAARLRRRTNPAIVERLDKLLVELEGEKELKPEHIQKMKEICSMIRKDIKRKIGVKLVGLAAKLLSIVALTLFALGLPAIIGLALIVLVLFVQLGLAFYEDRFQKKGIHYPKWTTEIPAAT